MEQAFALIREGRGSHFDPRVADAFVDLREEILQIKGEFQDLR